MAANDQVQKAKTPERPPMIAGRSARIFRTFVALGILCGALLLFTAPAIAQSNWKPVRNTPPFAPSTALQLTDGTVMVQELFTGDWWRLTPDITGSYINGTWSQLASMPAGYGPLYYASALLPDGRVIVEGGEYNLGSSTQAESNMGAIYDPAANKWTSIAPPSGWTRI